MKYSDHELSEDKLIEDYLNKTLSKAALTAFENRLEKDKLLKEEIAYRKLFRLVVKNKDTIQFHNKVKTVMATQKIVPDTSFKFNQNMKWWFGLVVVIVGVIGWWSVSSNQATKNSQEQIIQELTTTYLFPLENKFNLSASDNSLLAQGLRQYDAKAYQDAILLFSQYEKQVPADITPQFYLGVSYLFNQQSTLAIPYFEKIINTENMLLKDHAQWFLGWCYLKQERVSTAILAFENLYTNNVYEVQAREIVKRLNLEE